MSAVYHAEIPVDLAMPSRQRLGPCQFFYGDSRSHVFTALVADRSDPEAGIRAGTVTGAVLRQDGVTVALDGVKGEETVQVTFPDGVTANATPCSVTLTQECFAVPGPITITVKLTSGSDITSVLSVTGNVIRAETDEVVDPGDVIPDLAMIRQAAIDASEAADNANAAAQHAVRYDEAQELTDDQKRQARYNMDAAPAAAVKAEYIAQGKFADLAQEVFSAVPRGVTAYANGEMAILNGTSTSGIMFSLLGRRVAISYSTTPGSAQMAFGPFPVVRGHLYRIRFRLISGTVSGGNAPNIAMYDTDGEPFGFSCTLSEGEKYFTMDRDEIGQAAMFVWRETTFTNAVLSYEIQDVTDILPGAVRYDAAQTLTDAQKAQARENIDATDPAYVDVEELAWTGSGSIDNSGAVGSTVDMTVTSGDNYRYMVVDCAPGDRFTITGAIGQTRCLYSFLGEDNVLLSSDGVGADRRYYVVTAPAGAVKLIAQCRNDKYGAFGTVYKGVFVPRTIASMASDGPNRQLTISWANGGVTTSGFTGGSTNKRSDGLTFNPGERLVITNTDKNVEIAVYATKNGVFKLVGGDGYTLGGGRFVLRDWTWAYYIRLNGSTRPDPASGGYISAIVEAAPTPYNSGCYKWCGYPQIGIHRTYTNVKPMLTVERKTITDSGISDSTDSCLVTLPNAGWVEVKADANPVQFKIAKVSGGTVEFLVPEWSYYSFRYCGDGASDYYALVTKSPGASAGDDIMTLTRLYLAVYLYTDEGSAYEHGYALSGRHLAFVGDSITQGRFDKDGDQGHALETTTSKSFCELVAEMAGDDDVGNFGIGGARVSGNLWLSLLTNCGKVSGYDVVFVCGGTNDYGNNVTEADFRSAYETVVETLIAANTEVICCTPVYRTNKTGANSQGLWLSDYAAIIREIAAAKGCKCIDLLAFTSDGCFSRFCPDGLHPNEMGHKVMAGWIVQECDRLGLI